MEFGFDVEASLRRVASKVQGDGVAIIYGEKLAKGVPT